MKRRLKGYAHRDLLQLHDGSFGTIFVLIRNTGVYPMVIEFLKDIPCRGVLEHAMKNAGFAAH